MPVTILWNQSVVGMTLLELPLDAPGAVAGRLVPGPALSRARGVFGLYEQACQGDAGALERFVRERDALGLTLFDKDGDPVDGTVDLISDWGGDRWMVHLRLW
ncbi:MAG TPA: hypothetical protein VMH39_06415 [Gemmatimonadaceae bacterium]|nr:hypothetical protein [Gemmatimonadaceae bacterium]